MRSNFQWLLTQQEHGDQHQLIEYFKVANRDDFECPQHRGGKGLQGYISQSPWSGHCVMYVHFYLLFYNSYCVCPLKENTPFQMSDLSASQLCYPFFISQILSFYICGKPAESFRNLDSFLQWASPYLPHPFFLLPKNKPILSPRVAIFVLFQDKGSLC